MQVLTRFSAEQCTGSCLLFHEPGAAWLHCSALHLVAHGLVRSIILPDEAGSTALNPENILHADAAVSSAAPLLRRLPTSAAAAAATAAAAPAASGRAASDLAAPAPSPRSLSSAPAAAMPTPMAPAARSRCRQRRRRAAMIPRRAAPNRCLGSSRGRTRGRVAAGGGRGRCARRQSCWRCCC